MLKEGLDVYLSLVDHAIDAVIRCPDGSFTTVQIKARSKEATAGNVALFAAIPHEPRENYWFIFYSERMNMTWILSSEEFVAEASQNKTGKNKGKSSIWFNGKRKDRNKGEVLEHCKPQFESMLLMTSASLCRRVPNNGVECVRFARRTEKTLRILPAAAHARR